MTCRDPALSRLIDKFWPRHSWFAGSEENHLKYLRIIVILSFTGMGGAGTAAATAPFGGRTQHQDRHIPLTLHFEVPSMKSPSARTTKIVGLAAAPVAIVLAGAMVWQASNAAFTATTRNSGNSWSTGQVALTDDDKGAAAFTVENLVPGQTGTKCIAVTSNSTVPGEVRSYVQNLATSAAGLEDHITLTVERGTGGSFNNCDGFTPVEAAPEAYSLKELSAANHDYATGGTHTAWDTKGNPGESTVYRGTWKFDAAGLSQSQVDALQGARTSIDLVWELQSNDPAN